MSLRWPTPPAPIGAAPHSCTAPIERNHGPSALQAQRGASTAAVEDLYLGTLTTDFTVGNPRETAQAVALIVRPVCNCR